MNELLEKKVQSESKVPIPVFQSLIFARETSYLNVRMKKLRTVMTEF